MTLVALAVYTVDVVRMDWNAESPDVFTLALLVLVPLVAFAIGHWWTFALLLMPIAGAWWAERDCEPGLYFDGCGLAVTAAVILALLVGLPLAALGIATRLYFEGRR